MKRTGEIIDLDDIDLDDIELEDEVRRLLASAEEPVAVPPFTSVRARPNRSGTLLVAAATAVVALIAGGALADRWTPSAPATPTAVQAPFDVLENRCPSPPPPATLPWGGALPAYRTTQEGGPFRSGFIFEGEPSGAARPPRLEIAVQQFDHGLPNLSTGLRSVGSREVKLSLPPLFVSGPTAGRPSASPVLPPPSEVSAWWREGPGSCQIVTVRLFYPGLGSVSKLEEVLLAAIAALPPIHPAPDEWIFTALPPLDDQLGRVSLGSTAAEVVGLIGEPSDRASLAEGGLPTWTWTDTSGILVVVFDGSSNEAPGSVRSISALGRPLATSEGFAVGMTTDQFKRIYRAFPIDFHEEDDLGVSYAVHAAETTVRATFDRGGKALVLSVSRTQ